MTRSRINKLHIMHFYYYHYYFVVLFGHIYSLYMPCCYVLAVLASSLAMKLKHLYRSIVL